MTTASPGGLSAPTEGSTPDVPNVSELALAGDFAAPERAEWEELVASVLRRSVGLPEGTDPHEASHRLATITLDGITVEPLYTAADASDLGYPGVAPFVRGRTAEGHTSGWDIRQRHDDPDATTTRSAITNDLENGVTSLWLVLGEAGIAISDLPTVLAEVLLDLAPIVLDAGAQSVDAADGLLDVARERGVPLATLRGNLGFDPLGLAARTGAPQDVSDAVRWARRCAAELPGVRAITVDATAYHEAGASAAQELGTSLATGVAYLRATEGAGIDIADAASQLEFRYVASADQFLTIAKMRAARRLWARVTDVCSIPERGRGQVQHAVTSWAMATRRDPWVNLLRDTLACFGAGVGGVDAVTVLPFDTAIGLSDPVARRIARNTQVVLIEESNLARVIDPAGGSWYVESLTSDLAAAAWTWFQKIEAQGGIAQANASGFIAEELATTRQERDGRLARRKDIIVGVSEFPFLDETAVARAPRADIPVGGLPRIRYAEPFEALRDSSDRYLAEHGNRPTVFLAGLGTTRDRTARVSFARGALSPGGIETVSSAATDLEELAQEFERTSATVAILCSSDARYAENATAAAAAHKRHGAARVFLAGRPGESEDAYRAAGIDGFLYAGSDLLAALLDIFDAMGVR
jgi:methylmalonyl-CoA mutase